MEDERREYPGRLISWHGFAFAAAMKVRVGKAADRMLWRDIEREFNFKAAMRGKAALRKRAAEAS